ncbi:MAG: hypothetical protein H0U53_02790 [Actinobacteria bacterium]|nr:hypothetical protein [Actinomycetota bacterium]
MAVTDAIVEHVHPRVRYFVKQLFWFTVAWLSMAGIVSMARGLHKLPHPLIVGAFIVGAGLGAAFRDLPKPRS